MKFLCQLTLWGGVNSICEFPSRKFRYGKFEIFNSKFAADGNGDVNQIKRAMMMMLETPKVN